MRTFRVIEGVYWIGAVDWNIRLFHGPAYTTHRGTTYNSYLIKDEKVAVVDTVYRPFTESFIENIKEYIDPTNIDYIVVNHTEPDHSGAFPELIKLAPNATVLCTAKGKEGLMEQYHGEYNVQVVKTGDKVSLGSKTLTFVEAPMLHWPDSMFTYVPEDALLLPNDAFGQHIATTGMFDDLVDEHQLMTEAAKYYANILTPFSKLVLKKLAEVQKMGIEIKTIAPSHGIIWRKDPGKIINAYAKWAEGEGENKVVIVFDTMWSSTEKMARAIIDGIKAGGVEAKLFQAHKTDRNDIIAELLTAKCLLVGSSTINNDYLPSLAAILEDLKGLKPRKKMGAAFGSYGWRGGAVKSITETLNAAGVEVMNEGLEAKYVPTPEKLEECYAWGQKIAERLA
ncbi:flavodoxin domain-containing protein [Metallumcola ferriviriculae]|uniref:Flavodoxin domain-containing protein n=1 Tax=Metallumcola ferriviriculae TaxID=3039180 RepID=A0AAU0UTD0_9FIRM|nr:flavodoxin domain-containing protein [Desulfitibacteraceae bacterium MK1]